MSDTQTIESIEIYFGGMAEKTKKAEHACAFLLNKEWSQSNFEDASTRIKNDFSPISDARSGSDARIIMAENLFLNFFEDINNKL